MNIKQAMEMAKAAGVSGKKIIELLDEYAERIGKSGVEFSERLNELGLKKEVKTSDVWGTIMLLTKLYEDKGKIEREIAEKETCFKLLLAVEEAGGVKGKLHRD